ncbi:HAD-IA family hydrolase [Cognatitamlana onchidii]|uniref:HAD-IA family hydrolase n=1 Tax=Cognatitamlana onchidii TaxID=2562860 RepID=UPI0010A5D735|nr:HAD-IA family hydrolase [Algibacter onchidii]
MIKTIIFDFGNVFINLDIEGAQEHALNAFQIDKLSEDMLLNNSLYEQGLISTSEFLAFYSKKFPQLSPQNLTRIWNFMLKDFPKRRLDFLKTLKESSKYNLILLSNTNELHINWIKKHIMFYEEFKACFNKFYLSHEINLVKPNQYIFEFVLRENQLKAEECFFIDDNEYNILAAKTHNINTWHIKPYKEDVTSLFKIYKKLFD